MRESLSIILRSPARWAALAVVISMAGCALPPLEPDTPPVDGATPDGANAADAAGVGDTLVSTASVFTFDEDQDPEIARLPFVKTELLARILPGAERDDLDAAYNELGVTVSDDIPEIQTTALRVEAGRFQELAGSLAANPLFESVHKSYLYDTQQAPDDSNFRRQDHFAPIGVDAAWDVTTGSADMIIAILDTGVDSDHPDLKARMLDGWNAHDKNGDSTDVLGHGTAVAGSAGAVSDNGLGVAGVTWDNPILPVRVSDKDARAASKDIAAGIVWAVGKGAKVINISFAPLGSDRTVLAAARFARNSGALVFIATGNAGRSFRSRSTTDAVFVGALGAPDTLASFSNTGPFVDLVAPGEGIFTTKRGGSYGRVSGTSFSSPIVAGVAALVWSINPDFRPTTIENLLMDTAVDLGANGRDSKFGFGRVDAAAAVAAATETIEDQDTRAPTVDIINPHDRETVTGIVRVSVGAFDSGELADVVMSVDGEPFATDTAEPFRFAISTRKLTNGTHTLTATATDLAGNASRPDRVRITVRGGRSGGSGAGGSGSGSQSSSNASNTASLDNVPPEVRIEFPANGSRVRSSVGIQAVVTDDVDLESVEWLVDGVRVQTVDLRGTSRVVNYLWNASGASIGTHNITLRVRDGAGNGSVGRLDLIKE